MVAQIAGPEALAPAVAAPYIRSMSTISLEVFAGRGLDLNAMHSRMKSLMDAEGLPFARRDRTYNSRLAQELGKWGELAGRPAIHDALYRAYFVDGTDIGSVDALVGVAESVG